MIGQQLGRYRLTGVLGAGGMGVVFRAEHTGLGREVALKALLPELDHADVVERFQREARLLATLTHPHIVGIFDVDVGANGLPFYVMERLHGMSLGAALSEVGRPLTLSELGAVFVGIARALDHAHRQQVIHRDLKPENIFIERTATGAVAKLLDFGIAKQLGADTGNARLTQTGAVLGTPLYLSPEQLADEPLGPATDQFALALIIAECLLGDAVRTGQNPTRMLRQAMLGEVLDDTQWHRIPRVARPALARALAFEPDRRFADCSTLIEALGLDSDHSDDTWIRSLGLGAARSLPTPAPVTTAQSAAPTRAGQVSGTMTRESPSVVANDVLHKPHPPARQRIGPAGRFGLGVITVAALTLLAGWLWFRTPAPADSRGWIGAPNVMQDITIDTPTDTGILLGIGRGDEAVLGTRGAIHLQSLDTNKIPARQSIDGLVVGTTRLGDLLIRQGGRLIAANPRGKGERILATVPEHATHVVADRDGEWIAFVENTNLSFVAGGEPSAIPVTQPIGKVSMMALEGGMLAIALQEPPELRVIRLIDGQEVMRRVHDIGKVYDLAIQPETRHVALCGFAPTALVFDWRPEGKSWQIEVPRQCSAAVFLGDGPTLILRADQQLVVWHRGGTERLLWPGRSIGNAEDLPRMKTQGGRIWLHEPTLSSLTGFKVGPSRFAALNAPSGSESWDLLSDPERIYIGLSSGAMTVIEDKGTRTLTTHDAGITDLVDAGDAVASASDDRTLAVWRKPGLEVAWRSRGHDFLVNQLALSEDRRSLWSSSSDGSIKQWRWPDLAPMMTIDVRVLLGQPDLSLHAIWTNPAEDRFLLGTWNRQLLILDRTGDTWSGKSLPVRGSGGYRLLAIPKLEAVVLLHTRPGGLQVVDLRSDTLTALPDYGLDLLGLTSGPDPDTVVAGGEGGLILLRLRRDTNGSIEHVDTVRLTTAFGAIHSATWASHRNRLLVANQVGEVFSVDAAQLPFPEFADTPSAKHP